MLSHGPPPGPEITKSRTVTPVAPTISTIAFGSLITGGALIVAASGLRENSFRSSFVIRTCSV
jgi:hypothetical protein